MKYKLFPLVFILTACCVVFVNGAEPASESAGQGAATDDSSLILLRTKVDQTRSSLSELNELIKRHKQAISDVEFRSGKGGDAMSKELDRAIKTAKQELETVCKELKYLEKDLSAKAAKIEDVARVSSELEKTRKERLENEEKIRDSRKRLAALQNDLKEANSRLAELTKKSEEAEKHTKELAEANAALENERSVRAETLVRAEQAVAATEKVEKERLLLQGRLAELDQKIGSARENLAEKSKIAGELETEKKRVQENEEKIEKEEKAREQAEKDIETITKQIDRYNKMIREGSNKDEEARLRSELAKVRKQREETVERLGQAQRLLQDKESSMASLTNTLASIQRQMDTTPVFAQKAKIERELAVEKKALAEAEEKADDTEKRLVDCEKNVSELKKRAAEGDSRLPDSAAAASKEKGKLQSQLDCLRQQRRTTEMRTKDLAAKLQEKQKNISELNDAIADNLKRREADKSNAESISALADEVARENSLLKEVTANLAKREDALKSAEADILKSGEQLRRLQEQAARDKSLTGKLDDIKTQMDTQKNIRAKLETDLQSATRKQSELDGEKARLKDALDTVQSALKRQEKTLREIDEVNSDLAREKELALKSADKLAEKERSVKQLTDEQNSLQTRLAGLKEQIDGQKKQLESIAEARRTIAQTREYRKATDAKASEAERSKNDLAVENGKLRKKLHDDEKESAALSKRISERERDAGKEAVKAPAEYGETAPTSPLAAEQAILASVREADRQAAIPAVADEKIDRRSNKNRQKEAERHYDIAVQKWDNGDIDGAIMEFKETIRLNPDAAGAYYNIALASLRMGNKEEACRYACYAGESYLRLRNNTQATRMAVLISKIDPNSPFLEKLRNRIGSAVNVK